MPGGSRYSGDRSGHGCPFDTKKLVQRKEAGDRAGVTSSQRSFNERCCSDGPWASKSCAALVDGASASASYRGDWGVIVSNPAGGFVVVDAGTIRQVSATGAVTTIAANYVSTSREGTAVLRNTAFEFATNDAQTLTADGQGSVYIASEIGREVRRVDAAGQRQHRGRTTFRQFRQS